MDTTPRALLDALRLVTSASDEQLHALGADREAQIRKLREITRSRNVVGVGISEKVADGETTGELSLCFYVRRKMASKKVRGDTMVPPVVISSNAHPCLTDVKEVGTFQLHASAGSLAIRSGQSVSHSKDSAGTLGAIVRKSGKLFILSNSHVLAQCGRAAVGDAVISPGKSDGGRLPGDRVAQLSAFAPLSSKATNRVDAAIAEIDPARLADVQIRIPQVALPVRVRAARRGMHVVKVGKATHLTTAHVIDANFHLSLRYPHRLGVLSFSNQVLCTPFASAGDSGAIVIDVDSGDVVGLHFAGSADASVFNPIGEVISALGFAFPD